MVFAQKSKKGRIKKIKTLYIFKQLVLGLVVCTYKTVVFDSLFPTTLIQNRITHVQMENASALNALNINVILTDVNKDTTIEDFYKTILKGFMRGKNKCAIYVVNKWLIKLPLEYI